MSAPEWALRRDQRSGLVRLLGAALAAELRESTGISAASGISPSGHARSGLRGVVGRLHPVAEGLGVATLQAAACSS